MEAAKEGEAGGLAETLLGDGDIANLSWRREDELEEVLAAEHQRDHTGHGRRQRQHVGMVLFPSMVAHADCRVWVGMVLFSLMAAVASHGGAKAIGANSRIRPKQEEWWRTLMAGLRVGLVLFSSKSTVTGGGGGTKAIGT